MNKDDSHYQPISCDIHSQYELAIIQCKDLNLTWHEQGQIREATVTPLDLQTKHQQEFLIAKDQHGDELSIRLDHIQSHTMVER